MKKLVWVLFALPIISSCVSKSEYEKLEEEKNRLSRELQSTQAQLEEEKFGASKLLKEAQEFAQANNLDQSEEKLNTIIAKHPDKSEAIQAAQLLSDIKSRKAILTEDAWWDRAITSMDIGDVKSYLNQYPNGRYFEQAKTKFEELKIQIQQTAYDRALSENSSSAWKQFLADYPDHPAKQAIDKMLIEAEINEIMKSEHDPLPRLAEKYDSQSSSISVVEIGNSTSYNLTVRYSGPDTRMIVLRPGENKTITLASGNYSVAASVDASHVRSCAGQEVLAGKYSSTYTINTSRSYY